MKLKVFVFMKRKEKKKDSWRPKSMCSESALLFSFVLFLIRHFGLSKSIALKNKMPLVNAMGILSVLMSGWGKKSNVLDKD